MKNVKKVMLKVTIDWLKEKCKSVEMMFTKNHKAIVSQFKEFKARTADKLEMLDSYKDKLRIIETMNSIKFSVKEAE